MKELLRKNYSCKRLFHRKVKPHTSRQTSKWILNLKPTSLTQQKKKQQQQKENNNNNKKRKQQQEQKKQAKQTNKQTNKH